MPVLQTEKANRFKTPASIRGSERALRRRVAAADSRLLEVLPDSPCEDPIDEKPEDPSESQEAEFATRFGHDPRGTVEGVSGVVLIRDGMEE